MAMIHTVNILHTYDEKTPHTNISKKLSVKTWRVRFIGDSLNRGVIVIAVLFIALKTVKYKVMRERENYLPSYQHWYWCYCYFFRLL